MNKYKDILDKIKWSFSTTHGYDQCNYQFYLKKVCGEVGEENGYGQCGSLSHLCFQNIFSGEMSVDDALSYYIDEFDDYVYEYLPDSTKEKKFLAFCDCLANFDESYEEKYDVLGVEEELHWKVGKFDCVGYADLILQDKETKDILLIDFKSAGHFLKKDGTPLKNQQENFEAYSKQMYLYSKAIKEKYGKYPSHLIWFHFFENQKTVIPFREIDSKEAENWMEDTIKKIYKDKTFDAKYDYFFCNRLCDYRETCEYKQLEEEGE